eukprot:14372579-Alexandrium_andersonii.AAC.1
MSWRRLRGWLPLPFLPTTRAESWGTSYLWRAYGWLLYRHARTGNARNTQRASHARGTQQTRNTQTTNAPRGHQNCLSTTVRGLL